MVTTVIAVALGAAYITGIALVIVAVDTAINTALARRRERRDRAYVDQALAEIERRWEHR